MPKRNVTFTDNGGVDFVGFGFLDDDTHQIKLFHADKTLLTNQTLADDAAARAEIAAQATAQGWDAPEIATEVETPVTPSYATPAAAEIFAATVSAATDIHADSGTGSKTSMPWTASVNDTDEVTGFTDDDTDVQITNAGEIAIAASILTQGGANNRNTYMLNVIHKDSSDVVKRTYHCAGMYIRDDNNAYDSGIVAALLRLIVEAGDKLTLEIEVIDAQTVTATVTADTTYSKLSIDRVTYQV